MQTHTIKLSEHYENAVLSGEKNFEVRYNDRGYQKGDRINFKVVDNLGVEMPSPLELKTYEITYLIHGYGLEKDWCVFGFKEVEA